jgi:methylmalonyl-CoA mutase N-terminal domain/subunit
MGSPAEPGPLDAHGDPPTSASGIPLRDFYRPSRDAQAIYEDRIGDPGSFPFTRGKYRSGYSSELWIARNLAGTQSAVHTNERLRFLIAQGQTGLAIVPDTATQSGLDYDHPWGEPLVGLQGVPLACVDDMAAMCDGIDLKSINASFSTFQTPVAAQYVVNARRRGYSLSDLRGSIQNDPICARITGYDPGNPLDVTLRMAIDSIAYCSVNLPKWHSTVVNTYILREAGTSAVQEMAIGLAVAFHYLELACDRGVPIDTCAPRFAIIAGLHNDFFEEIVKLRATRRVWAKYLTERLGALNDKSKSVTISVHTCGSTLVAQQPINNVSRSALQALAALLGGCRGLDLSCYDEPFNIPSEAAATVALRTHALLELESNVAVVTDPLGGSYFIEEFTDRFEDEIWSFLGKIEDEGGLRNAYESGWLQDEIDASASKIEDGIDRRTIPVVGKNCFNEDNTIDSLIPINFKYQDANRDQFEWLVDYKAQRDGRQLKDALQKLVDVTRDHQLNVFEAMLSAMDAGATTGEVTGAIRIGYGEQFDPVGLVGAPVTLR